MPAKSSTPALSRRDLLLTGAAGAVLGAVAPAAAQEVPGPSPVDVGRVEGGRVRFPNWKGEADKPSPPPPAPLPDSERVGFALVGLGRLALEEVIPAFGETLKAKIVALVSGTPEKAAVVARQNGIPATHVFSYADMGKLRDLPDVRAVYVMTPNGLHLRDVEAAAAAGKHVLCEKPMANDSAEARQMIAACEKAKVKLMIAYRCQYEPYNRQAMEMVRSGEYGLPKIIEATNTQVQGTGDQWRFKKALAGGGALPDIGIYCLNAARFYTGEEPVEVFGRIHNPPDDPRYKEVEETVSFTLRFPSGLLVNCATSYGAHESKDMTLRMEKASITVPNAFAYRGQQLRVSQRRGDDEGVTEIRIAHENQFAKEIDHFASCVLEDIRPRTPGEEGLQDHVLMEAIYRSAAEGGPIALQPVQGRDTTRGPMPKEA